MFKFLSIISLFAVLLSSTFAIDPYHMPPGMIHMRSGNIGKGLGEGKYTPEEEKDTRFWLDQALEDLTEKRRRRLNYRKAKNIIILLGDGMSVSTLTAARILKGQRLGKTGEESKLAIDKMPYAGLSKTYCTNGQTPDSACTATAYLCGVKTNMLMIGVNAHVNFNNCSASADKRNHVDSIATWAQLSGKASGIVTTTTVTNASPSGSYAHVANRLWESDADLAESGTDRSGGCVDIATQLITQEPGRNFDVILGGGMTNFLPNSEVDAFGTSGRRLDGVNLIKEWQQNNPDGEFVTTRDELKMAMRNTTKRLFGTFNSGHLEFNMNSKDKRPTQPRLKDMAVAAIRTLSRNPRGYFLFIEGGRIDHGHHLTKAGLALDEMLEFDEAIEAVTRITNEKDTLVVVTADHSHTMSIAGYPGRGNPILQVNEYDTDVFGTPYATLNYAVGIEQYLLEGGKRENLTGKLNEQSFTPSYIKGVMGTHSGEDVIVAARGPHSHLFSGVMQQNLIPHLMAYAAKIDSGLKG